MREEWTKDLFKIGGPGFQVLPNHIFLGNPEYSSRVLQITWFPPLRGSLTPFSFRQAILLSTFRTITGEVSLTNN